MAGSKKLGILSRHYPNPINNEPNRQPVITKIDMEKGTLPTTQEFMDKFPLVFHGQVIVVESE